MKLKLRLFDIARRSSLAAYSTPILDTLQRLRQVYRCHDWWRIAMAEPTLAPRSDPEMEALIVSRRLRDERGSIIERMGASVSFVVASDDGFDMRVGFHVGIQSPHTHESVSVDLFTEGLSDLGWEVLCVEMSALIAQWEPGTADIMNWEVLRALSPELAGKYPSGYACYMRGAWPVVQCERLTSVDLPSGRLIYVRSPKFERPNDDNEVLLQLNRLW